MNQCSSPDLLANLSIGANKSAASSVHSLCNLTASVGALMLRINVAGLSFSLLSFFKTPWGEINRITDMKPKLSFNKIVAEKKKKAGDSIWGLECVHSLSS